MGGSISKGSSKIVSDISTGIKKIIKPKKQEHGLHNGRSVASINVENKLSQNKSSNKANKKSKTKADYNIRSSTAKDIIPEYIGKANSLNKIKGFISGKTIGEGNFGIVKTGVAKSTNKNQNISRVVVKKFAKLARTKGSNKIDIQHARNLAIQENAQNQLAGIFSTVDEKDHTVVTEHKGYSLKSLCMADKAEQPYKSKKMSVEFKLNIAKQVLEQLNELHKKGKIHQDLKPDNVVIDANGKVSLIDFGSMKDVSISPDPDNALIQASDYDCRYAPPEINYNNTLINNRYDSWTAGLIMYELFTGEHLLTGAQTMISNGWNSEKNFVMQQNLGFNIIHNKDIPPEVKNLILGLLEPNPNYRLPVKNALNLNVFKEKSKKSLIELNTLHNQSFKELAALEHKLENATKRKKSKEIKGLKAQIEIKRFLVKRLQRKINKFNKT